jgi:hypothetical protein
MSVLASKFQRKKLFLMWGQSPRPKGVREASFERYVEGNLMADIILLLIALSFFALSVGYAYACERL